MPEPSTQGPTSLRPLQPARPLAALGAPLLRVQGQLDSAIIGRLSESRPQGGVGLAKLEAWLLWRARMGIAGHIRRNDSSERVDPVVAETLLEASEFASSLITELGQGGLGRLARLWQGCREVVSELAALGIDVSQVKKKLMAQRQALTEQPATLESAERDVVALGESLAQLMRGERPANSLSPLEQLLAYAQ